MNVALWIVAALLAFAFGAAGTLKISQPKPKLIESGQGWAEDFSPTMAKTIGALEVLAAIALILPPLLDIAPVLAPLAATGLVLIMIGAAITLPARGDAQHRRQRRARWARPVRRLGPVRTRALLSCGFAGQLPPATTARGS